MPRVQQTKYWLAVAAFIVASIALFIGTATFGEWAAFMGVLFASYGAADIVSTHMQQAKKIPAEEQTA